MGRAFRPSCVPTHASAPAEQETCADAVAPDAQREPMLKPYRVLDLTALNPALVYVSITPFGQEGPKAHYADSDLIILAAGGPLVLTGDDDRPPVRVSVPQAYLHASAEAAVAALIAHHERQRSGQGQHVDVSAQQAVAQATQSGILPTPLHAEEFQRLSGGVRVGSLLVRLV